MVGTRLLHIRRRVPKGELKLGMENELEVKGTYSV